jgi:hypothetical protein
MKRPSTPASFMRRSTVSASFDVRISMNSLLASGFSRSFGVISRERARCRAHGVRMECEIVLLGEAEDADQVDRIALEYVRRGEIDAVVVDNEIFAAGDAPRLRPGRSLAITRLSTGAGLAC